MIAIKGFEMPRDCINCVMQFGGWCMVSPPEVDERVAETVQEAIEQEKPEWCPLVEIEAEPVRHGRWLSYTGTHYTGKENEYGDPEYKEHVFFVCSNCRRKTVVRENFCPRCGWMMTGGADNGGN